MISIELQGRLGNQLFQYAVCRAVAEHNGYDFHIDRLRWLGGDVFKANLGVSQGFSQAQEFIKIIRGHVCRMVKSEDGLPIAKYIFEEKDIENKPFMPEVFNIKDDTLLKGYFPSPKYFDIDDVRRWLRLRKTIDVPDDVCYINFRGGDFNGTYYQVSKGYYDEAVKIMKGLGVDKFIVITDDKEEARRWFPDYEVCHSADDFFILISSKYLIIGNSTYSFWAAILNPDNTVIAPAGWKNYNINKKKFNPSDIKVDRFIYI